MTFCLPSPPSFHCLVSFPYLASPFRFESLILHVTKTIRLPKLTNFELEGEVSTIILIFYEWRWSVLWILDILRLGVIVGLIWNYGLLGSILFYFFYCFFLGLITHSIFTLSVFFFFFAKWWLWSMMIYEIILYHDLAIDAYGFVSGSMLVDE